MLLTISTTHRPATDLGYLLGKNPSRTQSFELGFGRAHVLYARADEEECTAALLLDLDPVGLVRGRSPDAEGTLASYVNDRPYVASSFLSVAIAQVFGSALNGRSRERAELAAQRIPLVASISALPCRGGRDLLARLFEPLGYELSAEQLPLDEQVPEWGMSPYFKVQLRVHARLKDLLTHLYVLLPVLDRDKHYWVGDAELRKLLDKGEGWLAAHPEKEQIAQRYLRDLKYLSRQALALVATMSHRIAAALPSRSAALRGGARLGECAGQSYMRSVPRTCSTRRSRSCVALLALSIRHRSDSTRSSFPRRVSQLGRIHPYFLRTGVIVPETTDQESAELTRVATFSGKRTIGPD